MRKMATMPAATASTAGAGADGVAAAATAANAKGRTAISPVRRAPSARTGRLPAIGHWLDRLRETDAFLVRLCGSGGAVVALYETERQRDGAFQLLGEPSIMRGATL